MNKKLVIGIPGWKVGENSFGTGVNHLEYISKFGEPRIIMPENTSENIIEQIDLLYLPGGKDLNPSSYGETPGYKTSDPDIHKQRFYDYTLSPIIEANIPIFGVCLGFQMICAKFGVKLTQDFPFHEQSNYRFSKGHKVELLKDYDISNTIFAGIEKLAKKSFEVNSHHHQGVNLDQFPNNHLVPLLVSEDDKLVECVIHKTKPIFCVQWHPEEWYDDFCRYAMVKLTNGESNKVRSREVAVQFDSAASS